MNDDAIDRLRRENPVPDPLPAPPIEPVLARLGPRPPGRKRSRLGQASAVLGVGVAVAVAVLVVLLLGRGHGRTPVAGHHVPPQPPNDGALASYLNAAQQATIDRDPACGLGRRVVPGPTTVSDGAPSQALLSKLGVLRRPQTAADRLPAQFHGSPLTFGGILYTRYIRRARVVNGLSYYLIPGHFDPPLRGVIPGRCHAEQLAALQTLVASLPTTEREAIMRSGTQSLTGERQTSGNRPSSPYDGIELVTVGPGGGGGTGGISASNLENRVSIGIDGQTASGLVPDGVASVLLYYATTPSQNPQTIIAKATRVVTATVINNVYVVNIGNRGRSEPAAVVYRAANGTVLKRFNTNQ